LEVQVRKQIVLRPFKSKCMVAFAEICSAERFPIRRPPETIVVA
jgi:hypothetical protein